MPRPRRNPDEVIERELRITPPDQEPIDFSSARDDPAILSLVCYEEGGTPEQRLHYHCLIKTTMTLQQIPKWIYRLARAEESEEKGNAVFFSRKPHELTQQYICKKEKLSFNKGYTLESLDKWLEAARAYSVDVRNRTKQRKEKRADELAQVEEHVAKTLKNTNPSRIYVAMIIKLVLDTCNAHRFKFPTRPQMDAIVLRQIFPYNPTRVYEFYAKSFPPE